VNDIFKKVDENIDEKRDGNDMEARAGNNKHYIIIKCLFFARGKQVKIKVLEKTRTKQGLVMLKYIHLAKSMDGHSQPPNRTRIL